MLILALIPLCMAIVNLERWMGDEMAQIGSKKLFELDIPGTHHSGFQSVGLINKPVQPWTKCQKIGITEQLNLGARYFDLRIAERDDTLWFSHTVLSQQKLVDGLNEMSVWLKNHPTEIIMIDIRKDGEYKKTNTDTAFPKLMGTIANLFDSIMIYKKDMEAFTVKELVAKNKRLLFLGDYSIIRQIDSWGKTKAGNWHQVVMNVIDWIRGQVGENISKGIFSISSAGVTPGLDKDVSPPLKVADQLNEYLEDRLAGIHNRIGIIKLDGFSKAISTAIVLHNRKG